MRKPRQARDRLPADVPERSVDQALESVRGSDQHALDDVCRALPRGYAGHDARPETLLDELRIRLAADVATLEDTAARRVIDAAQDAWVWAGTP